MSRKRVTVPEDKKQQYIADILAKRRMQSEVAFLCDVTPGTVSLWVKAANEKIARDAAAAADYILGGSPEPPTVEQNIPQPTSNEPVGVDDETAKPVEQEPQLETLGAIYLPADAVLPDMTDQPTRIVIPEPPEAHVAATMQEVREKHELLSERLDGAVSAALELADAAGRLAVLLQSIKR